MTNGNSALKRFFKSKIWEKEYITRTVHTRKRLEYHFPNKFEWDSDYATVREMVRCEIAVQWLDGKILNDLEGSAWMVRTLKIYDDRLHRNRKALCYTLEQRMKFKPAQQGSGESSKEKLKKMFMKANKDFKA